jgi:periplasmic protein TonB
MARVFKGVSILVHAIVIAIVSYLQMFNPGLLPTPREALAFDVMPLTPKDIPLPPAPPRAPSPAPEVNPNAAPVVVPSSVTPETGHEGDPSPARAGVDRVEGGNGTGLPSSIGVVDNPVAPAPPPPPETPRHVGGDIRPPAKIINVDPTYPVTARSARIEGVVILEVIIATDGRVESVRVLRGVPMLDEAATTAVRQWRFAPARLNGQVVPVVMTVTVNFQLTR